MKKLIAAITCAVLFIVSLPVYGVFAEKEPANGKPGGEEEYVYTGLGNKVKKRDEELVQKYQQGITMEPEQIQARKERVEELGLEEYADERYFLRKDYYHQYSIDELEKKGMMLLVECMTEQDIEAWEMQRKTGILPRYITTSIDLISWTDTTGATIRTFIFDVDGHTAFCGDHDKTAPGTGHKHSEYIEVTDKKIAKFLYYGYGGPEDKMTEFGYSRAKSYCLMAFSIDKLRKGEKLGTSGTEFWNKIKDLPEPSKGKAYYVDTYGEHLQDLFFYVVPKKGKIQIKKVSENPGATDGNSCYSLQNAEYGVYTNANGVSGKVATLITGSNGSSQEIELDEGTYYVKELKAPKGFALDQSIHKITVTAGEKKEIKLQEVPKLNKMDILLTKVDADTQQNRPQGSGSLKDAQFTVKFYGGNWAEGQDPASSGAKPLRTWVFKTDENGRCYYHTAYKISGDELFRSSDGEYVLPAGTVTIQETKASEGYQINHIVYSIKTTSEGTGNPVQTYQKPVIPENIFKLDLVKKQEGNKTLIPGAEFLHIKPDGKTESVKTGTDGKLSLKGLQHGAHQLREVSVMDGYEINGNNIQFTVTEGNKVTFSPSIDHSKGDVKFEVTKEGNISIEMEDKVSPFCLIIHKVNDKNLKLDQAEFTLYEDKECKTKIAGGVTENGGLLKIGNLKTETKYYLKETKAPQGYRIPVDSYGKEIVYEIYTESIPAENQFTFYVNGKAYHQNSGDIFTVEGTKAEREVHMTIENKIGKRLPNTGSFAMPVLLLAGIIFMLGSIYNYRKGKSMRKFYIFVLAAFMSVFLIGENKVLAADMENGRVDFKEGEASITIKGNTDQSLKGKKFCVYQLFHAENSAEGESINYTFYKPFEPALKNVVGEELGKNPSEVTEYEVIDYMQTLNTNPVEGAQTEQKVEGSYSSMRYFIEKLRDELVKQQAVGKVVNVTSVSDENSIVIGGLEYGYYIVDEISAVENTHSAASLCMVNTLNPEGKVNIKSDYPSISKKICEDDKKDMIGENGWNDMADFEIGQTVPYKFISNVSDMNGYDTYYYAWHDIMDEALTFCPDTVEITINNGDLGDSYTLRKDEYKVITDLEGEETFKVEIQDLKAIVDREFNRKNSLQENIYGQEVILRYDAVLNDKAAENTGRPGFENDVKLEFSNNPDGDGKGETGETPWDTVVCFTYKLNGLKINNHKNELEGAKFRLYSDEACENEVYVKKTEQGYNVINRDSLGGNDHTGGEAPSEAVEMISGKDGKFIVFGLDGGTYWLKETEAPAGYRPILDPIRLEVIPTFVENRDFYVKGDGATEKALKNLEYAAYIRQFLDGIFEENTKALQADADEGSGNIAIVNKAGKKLPVTGSSMMLVMIGLGTGIMAYALIRRKKENHAE